MKRVVAVLLLLPLAGCVDSQPGEVDLAVPEPGIDPCVESGSPGRVSGLVATPGPGPGMTTITWASVADATSYILYRDDTPLKLGNTRSFGDYAPAGREYQVAGVAPCGGIGEISDTVTGQPLPGGDLLQVSTTPLAGVESSELVAWPALSDWAPSEQNVSWRIVEGTGNCCENYLITTPTGRIVDFGGTFLHYSDDEGVTWQTVGTVGTFVNGEGAIVVGPGGDVLAAGWDPYSGDRLWSHKYVAADDQWYYQVMPLHQPFFDRAWITAVKGPFFVDGLTVPYLTFVESNFHGSVAELLLRSNDGLHYAEFSESGLDVGQEGTGAMPRQLLVDRDRDWMQPISQSPSRPLDQGLGLQQRSGAIDAPCHWRVLHEDGTYGCPVGPLGLLPRFDPLLADGDGNLHHFSRSDGNLRYAMSPDMGSSWLTLNLAMPTDWSVRVDDQKVSAALDQAIWALHVNAPGVDGTITGDLLLRFRNVTTVPVLDEVLQVGSWDSGSDSGLGGDRRFDFMTTGFLPDGRAVVSFTDGEHHPPALAVEQPRV